MGKDETKRVKTVTQAVKPSQHARTPIPTPLPANSLTAAAVREDAGSGVGVAGSGVEGGGGGDEIAGLVADCITQIVLTVSSNVSLAAPR